MFFCYNFVLTSFFIVYFFYIISLIYHRIIDDDATHSVCKLHHILNFHPAKQIRLKKTYESFDLESSDHNMFGTLSLSYVKRFLDDDGFKFGGDHRESATPETTRKYPASEITRRTSLSRDLRYG